MKDYTQYLQDEYILWNATLGIRDFVTIGEIKKHKNTIQIWLDEPYEMVGPIDLKNLLKKEKVAFAACIIMTQKLWNKTKKELQQDSYIKQQKIHQKFQEELKQRNNKKYHHEQNFREILKLPPQGKLEITQIKTAYKKLAKTEHPDVGGSHKKFILITEAKEALILSNDY